MTLEDSDLDNSDNPSPISNTPVEPDGCDYGLNGDNLDWLKRPSIYSKDRDSESVHWFNLNLSYEEPIRNIMELPNSSFLPSPEEHAKLKKEFVLLVLRILAKNCKYFRQFGNMIPSHIPHQHEQAVPNCRFKRLLPSIEVKKYMLRS